MIVILAKFRVDQKLAKQLVWTVNNLLQFAVLCVRPNKTNALVAMTQTTVGCGFATYMARTWQLSCIITRAAMQQPPTISSTCWFSESPINSRLPLVLDTPHHKSCTFCFSKLPTTNRLPRLQVGVIYSSLMTRHLSKLVFCSQYP